LISVKEIRYFCMFHSANPYKNNFVYIVINAVILHTMKLTTS